MTTDGEKERLEIEAQNKRLPTACSNSESMPNNLWVWVWVWVWVGVGVWVCVCVWVWV